MDQAIELMVGVSIFLLGLSCLLRTGVWASWLRQIEHKGRYFSLILGSFSVMLGSLILGFHWIWSGLPMLTTLVGAAILLKGVIYVLFPNWLHSKLLRLSKNYKTLLRAWAIVLLFISIPILYTWWEVSFRHGINEFCSTFI